MIAILVMVLEKEPSSFLVILLDMKYGRFNLYNFNTIINDLV